MNRAAISTKDIFNVIEERDAVLAALKPKGVKRTWMVLGTSRGNKRLYTYNEARRLASRYNRRFATQSAYAAR
jgi:hypothetical protein